MNMQTAKAITEQMGMTWRGDFFDALSKEEKNAGYIKFNIPNPDTPENLNGEGVWGWLTPEDMKKYDDDSFTGKLPAILCNDPLNYFGRLLAGQEVVIRCTGETRPILDPEWVREHLTGEEKPTVTEDDVDEIEAAATRLLTACTDDYANRIWEQIKDTVIDDVIECSGIENGEGFSDGDVCLAIGRAICEKLGIEI